MLIRSALLLGALFLIACGIAAQNERPGDQTPFPPTFVPSGDRMYKQFCAACHGSDAKGRGPAASALKVAPPDLTILAKRNKGKFPYEYVSRILYFAPGLSAHGSSDMPTWGPIFERLDENSPVRPKRETAARDRIQNLSDYLASLQKK